MRDYPTMLFGPPKGFAGDPKLLHLLPPIDSAEELLKWINLRLGTYVRRPARLANCEHMSPLLSSAYRGLVAVCREFMLQTDTTYGHTYNTLGEGLNASMHDAAALPSHASVADMEKATVLSFEYMENSKVRHTHASSAIGTANGGSAARARHTSVHFGHRRDADRTFVRFCGRVRQA